MDSIGPKMCPGLKMKANILVQHLGTFAEKYQRVECVLIVHRITTTMRFLAPIWSHTFAAFSLQ